MKNNLKLITSGAIVAILIFIFVIGSARGQGQETCPQDNGWTKIDSDDLSSYPVEGATQYCFKAGSDNSRGCEGGLFDAIPEGGFNKPYCGLSHWSYFIPKQEITPTPTNEPTPTEEPTPTNEPTPTLEPTITATPTATLTPTPKEEKKEEQKYIYKDEQGNDVYIGEPSQSGK